MTSVIAVVGGGSFGSTAWGSTTAIPRNVANQIRPSLAFQHAGWWPDRTGPGKPSWASNTWHSRRSRSRRATASSDARFTRTTLCDPPSHRSPASSSTTATNSVAGSPCSAPTVTHWPSRMRTKPAPSTPTQTLPSRPPANDWKAALGGQPRHRKPRELPGLPAEQPVAPPAHPDVTSAILRNRLNLHFRQAAAAVADREGNRLAPRAQRNTPATTDRVIPEGGPNEGRRPTLKPEARRPKAERSPKAEIRNLRPSAVQISAFGFRPAFGLRI